MRRSFNNVVTLQSSVCNIDLEQSLVCSKIRAEELNEECNTSEQSRAYEIDKRSRKGLSSIRIFKSCLKHLFAGTASSHALTINSFR